MRISKGLRFCESGKHCFDTEARAILAALRYEQEHGKPQRVYRCKDKCLMWHTSTKYIERR